MSVFEVIQCCGWRMEVMEFFFLLSARNTHKFLSPPSSLTFSSTSQLPHVLFACGPP